MFARAAAAAAALAIFALAGCGSSGNAGSSTSTSSSEREAHVTAAPQSVSDRVLRAGELEGFAPHGQTIVGENAVSWVGGLGLAATEKAKEVARLERAGFRAGARERLAPTNGSAAEAISLVEQFGTPAQARAELSAQLEGLQVRGASTFPVARVPGARGVVIATTERTGVNIEFVAGPYYYVVGAGWPAHDATAPTRAQVEAAAQHLFQRAGG